MPAVVLRPAAPADGDLIAAIQLASWRATYGHLNPGLLEGFDLARTAANWAKAASDTTRRLRLAQHEGAVIGYAFSGPAEGEAAGIGELDAIYLLPTAHGLGAGRLLAQDALTGLSQTGHRECLAWVAVHNGHARGFYRHLGFHADGGSDVWRGLEVVRYRRPTVWRELT